MVISFWNLNQKRPTLEVQRVKRAIRFGQVMGACSLCPLGELTRGKLVIPIQTNRAQQPGARGSLGRLSAPSRETRQILGESVASRRPSPGCGCQARAVSPENAKPLVVLSSSSNPSNPWSSATEANQQVDPSLSAFHRQKRPMACRPDVRRFLPKEMLPCDR